MPALRLTTAIAGVVLAGPASHCPAQEPPTHGPFVGHASEDAVRVWARLAAPGEYTLEVFRGDSRVATTSARADRAHDLCVVWHATGLEPETRYGYRIERAGEPLLTGPELAFETAPTPGAKVRVRIAFGSCAREDKGTARVWERMREERPDAVVLLGDTPYIDSTDLAVQRRRYREFAAAGAMGPLLRSTPWYATWDDHDFGANDTDGRLPGKQSSRRAFVEYHANPSYGDGSDGIYTRFRRGPLDVFLLDTRTFAATEPSPFREHAASLLGAAQWRFLLDGLRESDAPFKVLACGMIWNGATRPGKLDHWQSYAHERDGLFRFLKEHGIGGVVLIGGDIHRSRVLRHSVRDLAGYDIVELITSPMHGSVIATADAPHPDLVEDMGEPNTFMLLDADARVDPPTLTARFVNASGRELFRYAVSPQGSR